MNVGEEHSIENRVFYPVNPAKLKSEIHWEQLQLDIRERTSGFVNPSCQMTPIWGPGDVLTKEGVLRRTLTSGRLGPKKPKWELIPWSFEPISPILNHSGGPMSKYEADKSASVSVWSVVLLVAALTVFTSIILLFS